MVADGSRAENRPAQPTIGAGLVSGGLAALLVLLVAIYLPVGLAAAVAQDGWTAEMRAGLGSEAPLPLRLFEALRTWLLPVAIALLVAGMANAVVRRARSRRSRWPSLVVILLTLALLAVVGSWAWSVYSGTLALVAAGAAAVAIVLFLTGLLEQGLRRRGFRVAIAALVAACAVMRLAADAWGHARLEAFDAQWEKEASGERARRSAAERPVLRGDALDEDGAPRYESLFDSLRPRVAAAYQRSGALSKAAALDPFAPIADPAREALAELAPELATLRETQRYRRCALRLGFDPGPASERPLFGVVRWLGNALVVAGHVRAQAGDLQGAADCYLAAVRLGGDIASGSLVDVLVGGIQEESGLAGLGRLILSGKPDAALLARIEESRGRLESSRASVVAGWRADRLALGHVENTMNVHPEEVGLQRPRILELIVPYRALAAVAVATADPLRRQLEAALAANDADGWARGAETARQRAAKSLNPMLRAMMGVSGPLADETMASPRLLGISQINLAWFRLVQAAILVEQAPARLELPEDPFRPGARLHRGVGPHGVRLWSVGVNGVDDGGVSDQQKDIVLEPAASS